MKDDRARHDGWLTFRHWIQLQVAQAAGDVGRLIVKRLVEWPGQQIRTILSTHQFTVVHQVVRRCYTVRQFHAVILRIDIIDFGRRIERAHSKGEQTRTQINTSVIQFNEAKREFDAMKTRLIEVSIETKREIYIEREKCEREEEKQNNINTVPRLVFEALFCDHFYTVFASSLA